MMITNSDFIGSHLPPISEDLNKYSRGYATVFAGSYTMAGAAVLCGKAVLKSGAGIVRLAVDRSVYPICAAAFPEAVYTVTEDGESPFKSGAVIPDNCGAVAFGCGVGQSNEKLDALIDLITCSHKPLLIDADGINLISRHIDVLSRKACPVVMTPHEGEMARLIGKDSGYVRLNRQAVAAEFAQRYGVTLLLKGKNTVISSPNGKLMINPTGGVALATAGSGDVLSGVITSFMCQGASPFEAAVMGAYIHGLSGDLAQRNLGSRSVTATDIIEYLSEAFKEC